MLIMNTSSNSELSDLVLDIQGCLLKKCTRTVRECCRWGHTVTWHLSSQQPPSLNLRVCHLKPCKVKKTKTKPTPNKQKTPSYYSFKLETHRSAKDPNMDDLADCGSTDQWDIVPEGNIVYHCSANGKDALCTLGRRHLPVPLVERKSPSTV